MAGDVFDLDAEGIALPGPLVRGLGEYAQGKGAAKSLYIKATDLDLATVDEIVAAADELARQNEKLNSSELDKLVRNLRLLVLREADTETVSFPLIERELLSLGRIAKRSRAAEILFDAFDEETGAIHRSDVIEAYVATFEDDGEWAGVVRNAEGSLKEKIDDLWDEVRPWPGPEPD